MKLRRSSHVLLDTGYFVARYEARNDAHNSAMQLAARLARPHVRALVPWPVTYEVIRTAMVRRPEFSELRRDFRRWRDSGRLVLVPDDKYRDAALQEALAEPERRWPIRHISLVDRVVRAMLSDRALTVGTFVTFNQADFEDICEREEIRIMPG